MKPNEIQTFYDYSYWAFERIWDSINQLTDEQFAEEVEYSTGSIRNIVVHLMSSTHRWAKRIQGAEIPQQLTYQAYNTLTKTMVG